jgi:hypothetical protein
LYVIGQIVGQLGAIRQWNIRHCEARQQPAVDISIAQKTLAKDVRKGEQDILEAIFFRQPNVNIAFVLSE